MPTPEELYLAVIDDHRRHPRNRGPLPSANRVARRENPSCGDICVVQLRLDADPARIAAVGFTGAGCALSQASASLMTVRVAGLPAAAIPALYQQIHDTVTTGRSPDEAGLGDLAALGSVHARPARHACALLAWQALLEALASTPPPVSDSV
jgi:nitrogen fixation protein NifU and related proteins